MEEEWNKHEEEMEPKFNKNVREIEVKLKKVKCNINKISTK